jgi:hypothetical protein
MNELAELYREYVGREPAAPDALSRLLDEAFLADFEPEDLPYLKDFLATCDFLSERIAHHAESLPIFRHPAILIVYDAAQDEPYCARQKWPLTPDELSPVFVDLGINPNW